MHKSEKYLNHAFIILLFITIIFSSLNIFFRINNSKLKSEIENLKEKKLSLRAAYFSKSSMLNLSSSAFKLKMSQADKNRVHKIKKEGEKNSLKEAFKEKIDKFKSKKSLERNFFAF